MTDDPNTLTLREPPIVFWAIAALMIITGIVFLILYPHTPFLWAFDLAMGLVFLLLPKTLTVTADRITQMLTLSYRGLLWGNKKEIPLRDIAAVQLQGSHDSDGGSTYRIILVCQDGQVLPFHSYYSSGMRGKQKKVDQLRAFLGVGGGDVPGSLGEALQMVKEKLQERQEELTGSQAEEHLTDGVHWQLQTSAFGGSAVTRWFSPDSQFPDGFLFLTQNAVGQKVVSGGLMGGVGKFLYAQSLKIYGFGSEDTPGVESASVLAELDPGLKPYFSAFTSNPAQASRRLNPWVVAPLVDWAGHYPLKTIQTQPQVFSQLVVLFSPRGTYVATLGTLIPEAVEELTRLGVELVKAHS